MFLSVQRLALSKLKHGLMLFAKYSVFACFSLSLASHSYLLAFLLALIPTCLHSCLLLPQYIALARSVFRILNLCTYTMTRVRFPKQRSSRRRELKPVTHKQSQRYGSAAGRVCTVPRGVLCAKTGACRCFKLGHGRSLCQGDKV